MCSLSYCLFVLATKHIKHGWRVCAMCAQQLNPQLKLILHWTWTHTSKAHCRQARADSCHLSWLPEEPRFSLGWGRWHILSHINDSWSCTSQEQWAIHSCGSVSLAYLHWVRVGDLIETARQEIFMTGSEKSCVMDYVKPSLERLSTSCKQPYFKPRVDRMSCKTESFVDLSVILTTLLLASLIIIQLSR